LQKTYLIHQQKNKQQNSKITFQLVTKTINIIEPLNTEVKNKDKKTALLVT